MVKILLGRILDLYFDKKIGKYERIWEKVYV